MHRAGKLGGLAAWVGFTLPSAVILAALALWARNVDLAGAGWVHGLELAAAAVVLTAVIAMARTLARGVSKLVIAIAATLVALFYPGTLGQLMTILVAGMYLLSLLGVGKAPWLASVYMLVVGIGIGLVMQVLVLVVQNDARPQDIGVATSTATFCRSVGGAFGVAIFGTIFATRLSDGLAKLPHRVTASLGSGVHLNPIQVRHLPPAVHTDFLQAFAHALHGAFLWGMLISIVPFALSWLLKEVPLRTTLGPAVADPGA